MNTPLCSLKRRVLKQAFKLTIDWLIELFEKVQSKALRAVKINRAKAQFIYT